MTLRRTLAGLLGALLIAPAALAQTGDEDWGSFKAPAGQPPAAQPPAGQPAPAGQPPAAQPAPGKKAPAAAAPGADVPAVQPAPAGQPPVAQPAPAAQPLPQPGTQPGAQPPAHAPGATQPAPAGTTGQASPTPGSAKAGKGEAKADETKLVSTKESYVVEEVDHSPATLGNPLNDERNLRNASAINGQVGLLHTSSADFGRKGTLRLSANGEYFRSSNFPVLDASDVRSAGTFALGYTFVEWLQAYASYSVVANTNSKSAPRLIQDMGDAQLGLSLGHEFAQGFHAGIDLRALIFPGVGNQDISRSVFGFAPRALLTYTPVPKFPVRLHGNVGFILDKTDTLASGHTLTASEEFALDVNHYNRLALGAALELPLPIVSPFAEYNGEVPLGTKSLVAPDNTTVSVGQTMHQTLGLGLRVTAVKDLSINAAFDLGLARTVAYGIPATQPWNFVFGVSYTADPLKETRTKVVDNTYERKVPAPAAVAVEPKPAEPAKPTTGKVEGVAVDAATGTPISGVLVALSGSDLPPVATDSARGRFLSYELPPGIVRFNAEHAGYHAAQAEATIEAGKTATVELKLVREVEAGSVHVRLKSKGKPVTAPVQATGATQSTIQVAGEGSAELPAGHYTLSVAPEGYEPASKEIDINPKKKTEVTIELVAAKKPAAVAAEPKPKKGLVVIIKNKIVIKQQVHFATNKATILRDSYGLLDEVASVIKENGLKKVEVAGHTDNQGDKATNLKLSQDRADSVKAYLVKKGVDSGMLEAKGYGDTKPIAPNMTPKGRELNRRVEFTILEK